MVVHRRSLAAAEARRAEFLRAVSGNGALGAGKLARAQERVEREAAALARCAEAIQELGGVVKDLEQGLVDFPARRGDEDVFLCWRLGEAEVEYWHGVHEGFGGRRSLPM
jgi:hypothetical protein